MMNVEELKLEVLRRAQDRQTPFRLPFKMEDVELFVSRLRSLDRDHWAAEWCRIAEPYEKRGDERLNAGKKKEALENHFLAYRYYYFGRYPLTNSPGKRESYRRDLRAFLAAAKLFDPPLEHVTIPFHGKQIVGYFRVPKGVIKPPLVFHWGGIDAWKEDTTDRAEQFLSNGWGSFVIDVPGTGENPVLASPDADRVFSTVIDYLQRRPEIDANRIAVVGTSFGGYWAVKMAYLERQRIRAAVNFGGPTHYYFQPDWQRITLQKSEYLFDWFEAQAALYGVTTMEDYLETIPKLSLKAQGILGGPSCPLLSVNGKNDSLIPIADLYLLMEEGSPKFAWVNPDGQHMGSGPGGPRGALTTNDVFKTVIIPWLRNYLSNP